MSSHLSVTYRFAWFFYWCVLLACGTKIERQESGDYLYSFDINCAKYNARETSSGTCFCGLTGSFYTDKDGNTKCFPGRGAKELGE